MYKDIGAEDMCEINNLFFGGGVSLALVEINKLRKSVGLVFSFFPLLSCSLKVNGRPRACVLQICGHLLGMKFRYSVLVRVLQPRMG